MGCSLIVCEPTGRWAAAISRLLPKTSAVCQTRTFEDCRTELLAAPHSVVAVAVSVGNLLRALHYLSSCEREFPGAVSVALAERGASRYGSLLREAGAVHVVASIRELQSVADITLKQSARFPMPHTATQQMWAELPWADAAAASAGGWQT